MTETHPWFGATLAAHAELRPSAPAIIRDDGTVTFAQAHRAIERIAGSLLRRGARPGQPLVLVLEARTSDLFLLFACHRLGVPVLVLSAQDPLPLAEAMIAAAPADLVVSGGGPVPPGLRVRSLTFARDWLSAAPGDLPPPPDAGSPCYLVRSSGTTGGVPKLVMTTHGQETADLDIGWSRFPLGADDRYLTVVGFQFAFGRGGAQRALIRGGAAILPPPLRSMDDLLAAVRRHRATWTQMTPTHLRHLLAAAPEEGQMLPGLRILAGAAPLAPAERRALMRSVTSELYMDYGTNEVGCLAMATPDEVRRNPEGVGRPIPGVEAEVVDEGDRPCPQGTIGSLRYRSPLFPTGYRQSVPGATSRFAGGWFYPGDIGFIAADGQIVVKGRIDDLIDMGGVKVYPADVEDCLAGHPEVVEAAVVGIPDRLRGTAVTAAVVLRSPVPAQDLLTHCHAALGAARSPARMTVLDALPHNAMGKIDRVALRRLLADGTGAG